MHTRCALVSGVQPWALPVPDGAFVQLGDRTDAILAHYRRVWPDRSPGALMVRVETAGSWRYLSNRLADAKASARAAPTWVYVMTFAGGTTGGDRKSTRLNSSH